MAAIAALRSVVQQLAYSTGELLNTPCLTFGGDRVPGRPADSESLFRLPRGIGDFRRFISISQINLELS